MGTYFLAVDAAILGPLNGEYLVMRAYFTEFTESDDGLESICVYNHSGKLANISRLTSEETETKTEAEPSAYPFLHSPSSLILINPLCS